MFSSYPLYYENYGADYFRIILTYYEEAFENYGNTIEYAKQFKIKYKGKCFYVYAINGKRKKK
jgi:hypothetical protein